MEVEGAKALAANPNLARLTSLSLRGCRIQAGGARALWRSSYLQGLRVLDLSGNEINKGMEPLTDPGLLPELTACQLDEVKLSPALAKRLRAARPGVFRGLPTFS
jgi:hypothetical protein